MNVITERRKNLKLTQGELAAELGVTQGAVSQWENGIAFPSLRILVKLAAVLHCTVDEILRGAKQ